MTDYGLPDGVELPGPYRLYLKLREAFISGTQDGYEGLESMCNNLGWLWSHSTAEEKAYAQGYDAGKAARQ